jgi:hypothetical protein
MGPKMPRLSRLWNTASSEASRGGFAPGRAPVRVKEATRRDRREPNIPVTVGELEWQDTYLGIRRPFLSYEEPFFLYL